MPIIEAFRAYRLPPRELILFPLSLLNSWLKIRIGAIIFT